MVHVVGIAVIGPHELRLLFEDGTVDDVAFDNAEWTDVFEPLRDPTRFARVVVDGGIAWPDDGLDLAPEPRYAAARQNSAVAVTTAEELARRSGVTPVAALVAATGSRPRAEWRKRHP